MTILGTTTMCGANIAIKNPVKKQPVKVTVVEHRNHNKSYNNCDCRTCMELRRKEAMHNTCQCKECVKKNDKQHKANGHLRAPHHNGNVKYNQPVPMRR